MNAASKRTPLIQYALWGTGVIAGLLALRWGFGYPVFHSVAELFAIVVAIGMFMIVWNSRRHIDNGYVLFLGIAYFFVASVDILHMLSYQGVELFTAYSALELPTQLWLVARYLQASAVLLAPYFVEHKVHPGRVFGAYLAATLILVGAVFAGFFPSALPAAGALTPFKIWSEWIVIGAFAIGLVGLWVKRATFDPVVLRLLVGSVSASIAAEFAFTLYGTPQATANLIGHMLRILAYFLLYRAIIETSVSRPMDIVFRQLTQTSNALAASETRFRSTFEQAHVGIAHISMDGAWLLANPQMSEITGYTHDQLLELSPSQITFPEDRAAEKDLRESLVRGERSEYRLEKRYLRPDGQVVWVNLACSIVRGENDLPLYFVVIVEDISDRKRAEEGLRRARDLSDALGAINRAINSTFDRDEVMRRVTSLGTAIVRADTATVWVCEEDLWVPSLAHGYPDLIVGRKFTDDQVPYIAECVRLEAPLSVPDLARQYPDSAFAMGTDHANASILAIPLNFRDERYGVLTFGWSKGAHESTRAELDFAQKLGAALALAIDNARLYAAERRIADIMQASMLHMDHDLEGVDVAWAYHSATELRQIGGDFFDAFTLDDGRLAFVIGDVAGKGIEAAALTTIAKSTLRAFAYELGEPAPVAAAVNRSLSQQVGESRFITAIYALLDPSTGVARFVCCGHPLPLVYDELGRTDQATTTNPPLGALDDTEFSTYDVHLKSGERIIMFSDGLLDARRGADFFGEERVHGIIDELGDADPRIVVDSLMLEARKLAGGAPTDDIAIMAVRYLGTPDECATT